MLQVNLDSQVRTGHGKGAARTLRRMGQTPAVLYGAGGASVSLALNTKILTKELLGIQRRNAIVNLDVAGDGKKYTKQVLIKEVQVDPIKGVPLHADFCEISLDTPMTLSVPLVFTGKAKGVDLGGEMLVSATSIIVKAKPLDIPDSISVDVTALEIGDSITYAQVAMPTGATMMDRADKICVAVTTATVKKAGEEGGEGAAATEKK